MAGAAETFAVPEDTRNTQARVADPRAHAWVSANAGSGKTYVLSRRVLRLLLDGAAPEAILCLTYTNAAAAEMRHRVTGILAGWARADDQKLDAALADLLGRRALDAERVRARSLFAHALDTPGGLRISTIHAFCEAVLQRFPREAGVPVDFKVIEEETANQLLREARERVLADGLTASGPEGEAVRALFATLSDFAIEKAIAQCLADSRKLGPVLADPARAIAGMRAHLGAEAGETAESVAREIVEGMEVPVSEWPEIFAICPPDREKNRFEDKLDRIDPANPDADALFSAYLTKEGAVPARFPKSDFTKKNPALVERLTAEAARLEGLFDKRRAVAIAENSQALIIVLAAIVRRYESQKRARSLMDFDDLVARTAALLRDTGLGPWVRYKLDAGIDHILVDESQDTNPEQWAVIDALADDYFSGAGAAGRPKTLFAVGDPKQSIYSFQGAEPRLFLEKGERFSRAAKAAGQDWRGATLRTSFRTLPEILTGVDTVFNRADIARSLLSEPDDIRHESARRLTGGMIEIWPVIETPEPEGIGEDWPTEPVEGQAAPPRQLANRIAETIAGWIENKTPLGPRGRAIRPEDILILVQKRKGIFPEIVRALKHRNIASPGSDRLPVSAHIAIDDLLGLADLLLNPGDDLTLAAILRSPLFEISEDQLFTLAHGRAAGETLWARLEASEMAAARAAHERLCALRQRLDLDRPYEFFAHLLYAGGGLKRFHARLGAEVDEVIAEFLDLALEHEKSEQPSLTGFIAAMRASDIVIKRDLAATAAGVRVMTVHGAKGLEAPIVILADAATKSRGVSETVFFGAREAVPFLVHCANADSHCAATRPLRAALDIRAQEEYWRNLYVAMTRAEDRLYVAGTLGGRTRIEDTWHGAARQALEAGSDTIGDADGDPVAWRYPAGWSESAAQADGSEDEERTSNRPLTLPPPARKPVIAVLTPSGHEDTAFVRDGLETLGESLLDARSARNRGIALHALLQHLSDVPQDRRDEVAQVAAQTLLPDDPGLAGPVAAQALDILSASHLAHLFGPHARAEVPFSLIATRNGAPVRLEGRIDRLVVREKDVLVIDYKSDAAVPVGPESVGTPYRRQLGLYRKAVQRLFPATPVSAAILWTQNKMLMELPPQDLDEACADVSIP